MKKTIKYLENKGFFERLKVSSTLAETFFERVMGARCPERAKREAYKELIMRELTRDKDLLDALLDDVTDEIIKHI